MVFESVVAELLNRFLGDFVDNLDSSQLNIGIWGGDVKLSDLELKESALDDFDLPIKLKFGCLSELTLKIPWKSLYTEPVIAEIQGLHLIIVPNKGVLYNEEKTKKRQAEEKQKTLLRLEEGRKKRRKAEDTASDSFTEKLIAQVIKNLQVSIRNIHVRFEDKYTNRHRPFVAGLTLQQLLFTTTDENWQVTIHKEAVKIIYKLISLNSFAIYWNSDSKLISDVDDRTTIRSCMEEAIALDIKRPEGYKYVLEPIKMETKLSLNQKPEADGTNWTTPKVDLKTSMEILALSINRFQYQDILLFLEALERFETASRYLKYHPNLNVYSGHYKLWWHFAYNSILEENIRRKRRNWSWEHMKNHRNMLKNYKEAWIKKQTEKNPNDEFTKIIETTEEAMDVFNINIARQQAEMEIDRSGLVRVEDQPQGWINWAKSWWGGGGANTADTTKEESKNVSGVHIVSRFEEAMTPEEKAKLFEAIDYQENTPPTDYPKHFIENVICMELKSVLLMVEDALCLKFTGLNADIQQRPSARAINIKSGVKSVSMDGFGQTMLTMTDEGIDWMNILIDTNPLNQDEVNYDQFVKLTIAQTLLKYHAKAINAAIEVLRPPESVRLNQLTAAAMARYEDVKTRSTTGLAHAVEMKTKLKLDVKICPATIAISQDGIFSDDKRLLLIDLGLLSVSTVEDLVDRTQPESKSIEDKLEDLMTRAYDKFAVEISNVQMIFADNYNEAIAVRRQPSNLHLLNPTGMNIDIHKSSIDDLQLPKIRVLGKLPDIVLNISDETLLNLLKLLMSIPTPEPEKELKTMDLKEFQPKTRDRAKMRAIMEVDELSESSTDESISTETESEEEKDKDLLKQQVQLEMCLSLNEIGIMIGTKENVVLAVKVSRLGCSVQMRTFDTVLKAHLGSLTIEQPLYKGLIAPKPTLFLLDSIHDENENLLDMQFIQANPESPFFTTEYKSTEQSINIAFKGLAVSLHQEALMNLKLFGENLQQRVNEIQAEKKTAKGDLMEQVELQAKQISRKLSQLSLHSLDQKQRATASDSAEQTMKISSARKQRILESAQTDPIIKTYLVANFDSLSLYIGSEKCLDTAFSINDFRASVVMKLKTMRLLAGLRGITMQDCTGTTIFKDLLTICGDQEMFTLDFTQYIRSEKEKKQMTSSDLDMAVICHFAQMRFVFLNLWLSRLTNWMEPFQAEAALAAAQAQTIASEKAAEAAQNVRQLIEETQPRVSLNIEFAAPTILIPRKSTALQTLIFDLGNLTIRNSFPTDPNNARVIFDKMHINLTDINFSIGLIKKDESGIYSVVSKCDLLKPLTFLLAVNRNLCFSWYKNHPEISVDARLPSISLNISQEDYATIMNTLSGNLAETTEKSSIITSKTQTQSAEAADTKTKEKVTEKVSEKPTAKPIDSVPAKTSSVQRIAFNFSVDEISAILFMGSSFLEESKQTVVRNSETSFASVKLLGINLNGSLMEDNAVDVSLNLTIFTMNDERKSRTRITKLLDKSASRSGEVQPYFMQISYQQNSLNEKTIVVSSSAFFLCLCPEFLGSLANFFIATQTEKEEEDMTKPVVTKTNVDQSYPKEKAPPSAGKLSMKCKIHEVEVILVEDSNKPETTQALILSFNCDLSAANVNDTQEFHGGIRNLQMISSYYLEEKRLIRPYQVLNRVEIAFKGTIDDVTKAQLFDVNIGQIHLKVSPSIIRLLSAVGTEFSSASQPKSLKHEGKKPVLKKYPNYWDINSVKKKDYWWFDLAQDSNNTVERAVDLALSVDHEERAQIKMESLIITLESGFTESTVPMILVESSLQAIASDWSSSLSVDATLSLQVSYFNEKFSVWEPVIEPIETEDDLWQMWKMNIKLRSHSESTLDDDKNDDENDDENNDENNDENKRIPTAKQTIVVKASNMLNIIVTKSFLFLLNNLSDVFERAAKQITPPKNRELPGTCAYLILNNTGISIKIANSSTLQVSQDDHLIDATACSFVELDPVENVEERIGLDRSQNEKRAELRLVFDELETEREINVMRAEIRTISLPRKGADETQWKLVTETRIENFRRLVTLRSLLQFVNHMDVAFEVHSMRDTMLDLCGVVQSGSEPLDIALPLLYSSSGHFYLKPFDDGYDISNESINWSEFHDKARYTVRCDQTSNPKIGLFVALFVEQINVKADKSHKFVDQVFIVHLYPPITLQNLLPYPLYVESPIEETLQGGEVIALNLVAGQKIKFKLIYLEETYFAELLFVSDQTFEILSFTSKEQELNIGVHWSTEYHKLIAQIYAPYWFVNNTGRALKYMESRTSALTKSASCMSCRHITSKPQHMHIVTQESLSPPVLLNIDSDDFLNKKKARLQLAGTEWSDEFPLDAVGSTGQITCKGDQQEYSLTVDVQLCQSGLSKVVTFRPFYLVNNASAFNIEVKELSKDEWFEIPAESCVGLWPKQTQKRKFLIVRYSGSEDESISFPFTEGFHGFCQIDNEYLGIYASCTIGESSCVIRIESFQLGMCPALIMNATNKSVMFCQKGAPSRKTLNALECCYFAWADVTHNLELEWNVGEITRYHGLFMNSFDSYKVDEGKHYYLVSFLNGRQRVLLFTDDLVVMKTAQAYEIERPDQSVELRLQGIGLSLVDNINAEEILYMGIASSAIMWEQFVRSRFRLFTGKQTEMIENAHQAWLKAGGDDEVINIDKFQIDFSRKKLKKKKNEFDIRRQFQTGLWVMYKQGAHQTQLHFKLNHLQMDNQLTACVFPCVLTVIPPPKSVLADNAPKPFMELSFLMRRSEYSSLLQIKYLHLLVQEFSVEIDQGLINALIKFITVEENVKPYTKEVFDKDLDLTKNQLAAMALSTTTEQQQAFYDDLHISPLMIHLSFSQGGASSSKDKTKNDIVPIQSEFINVLLKSVGVTLTELKDVVFKLAFFERKSTFYNRAQLQGEIISHYTKQAIKQLYVLVLGLDIIGNPFGLVRDLSTGVEDFFYQPFQGAIQGPEEFAEGVALGVKSLFGATVGGASGAVSRITGTLGKGVAALTLDEDYQRKRQQAMNRRPRNFREGMTKGVRGVVQGFQDGITGVVSKPIEGAKTSGFGGFAAGVGKGLLGAVVRPVSGVVDFASGSLEAVKTVASGAEETKPLRPPRVIFGDNIVRPYSVRSAVGAKIFRDCDRGSVADTDCFVAHASISEKAVFIITDKRVMLVKRSDLVGSWDIDWEMFYFDMNAPEVIERGIKLQLKKKQKGFLGIGASSGKVVEFNDDKIARDIALKLIAAYEAEVQG